MGDVVSLAEYRQQRLGGAALAMRKTLVAEFERAAYCLPYPDFHNLAKGDNYERETFTFHHVQKLLGQVRRAHPQNDLFAVEIEATKKFSDALKQLCEEVREGASVPVIRREWQRQLGGMVEKIADVALPIIAGGRPNRNGAPDHRNG